MLEFCGKDTIGNMDVFSGVAETSTAPGKLSFDVSDVVVKGDRRVDGCFLVRLLAVSGENALGDGDFFGSV